MKLRKKTLRWVVSLALLSIAILLTVFVCFKNAEPDYDPDIIDSRTIEYISSTDFANDVIASDSRIATVDHVKITRQDNIPIALVSYTFKPEFESGRSVREFYYFEYQTICAVAEFANNNPNLSTKQISEQLSIPELQIRAMIKIAR